MTPQLEEAQRLLRLARRDRETFDLLFPLPKASLAALGFLAQQSAEKALKAVAALRSIEIRRTHDLAALGRAIFDVSRMDVWRDSDRLRIRVTDDGPGFADPQAVLARRVRLDERVPGHGIGLAVVSDLVASHQGELTLSSAESDGAQLDIVLPAA